MTLSRLLDARRGPDRLVLVRHGESVGNLADARARESGADRLDLDARDADVELSETGQKQADAVGGGWPGSTGVTVRRWFSARRTVVPPRPHDARSATLGLDVVYDERLRERDLGVFDGLTGHGIRSAYPEESERRKKLGKFYYQPPSGESWSDVVLRVRGLLTDVRQAFDGGHVWIFSHQAVIMSFRYVLEGLTEEELLEIDGSVTLGNASMTRYKRGDSGFELEAFADTSAVDESDEQVTHEESRVGDGEHAS